MFGCLGSLVGLIVERSMSLRWNCGQRTRRS